MEIAKDLAPLTVPIDSIRPDPDNVRLHDDEGIAAIAASLERFGQLKPIVAQLKGKAKPMVRAGNGTLAAALSLGATKIAVVKKKMTDKEAQAFAVADNRLSDISSFDDVALGALLASLGDDIEIPGFADDEIEDLILAASEGSEGFKAPEEFPDANEETNHKCPKCKYQWNE